MFKAKTSKFTLLAFLGLMAGFLCYDFFGRGLAARLTPIETSTHVIIEGVNYGTFDSIGNLDEMIKLDETQAFKRISLHRDFVTDPSLCQWAHQSSKNRSNLANIELITKTQSGQVVSRYMLHLSKPLSWTVELSTPELGLGGFHERIELAVQKITAF